MFNRRYIFKWWIPHCYVSLQDCIFYDYSMYQRTVLQSACITCITCCHIMSVQLPCSKIDAGRDPSLRPSESVAVADKLFMGTADLKSKKSLQMLSISRPTWTFEDVRLYVKFYLTQRGSPSRKKLSSSCNRNSCFIFFRFRVLRCQQPCFLATHPCPLIRAEIRTHGCHKNCGGSNTMPGTIHCYGNPQAICCCRSPTLGPFGYDCARIDQPTILGWFSFGHQLQCASHPNPLQLVWPHHSHGISLEPCHDCRCHSIPHHQPVSYDLWAVSTWYHLEDLRRTN